MLVDHLTVPDQPFKQRAAIPIVEALRSTPPLEIQTTGPHPNATTPAPLAACAAVQTRRPRTLPTATVLCPCLLPLVFATLPCLSSTFASRMPRPHARANHQLPRLPGPTVIVDLTGAQLCCFPKPDLEAAGPSTMHRIMRPAQNHP